MLLQPCPGSVELAHLVQVPGATSGAALMSVFRGCTVTRSLQQQMCSAAWRPGVTLHQIQGLATQACWESVAYLVRLLWQSK